MNIFVDLIRMTLAIDVDHMTYCLPSLLPIDPTDRCRQGLPYQIEFRLRFQSSPLLPGCNHHLARPFGIIDLIGFEKK